jgi:hypothetical protein
MATATLPPPGQALAALTHRELIQSQWHFGVAADPEPAFPSATRRIVKRFCQRTGFAGMQLVLLRSELLFATYGRDWSNGQERYEWQRWADRDLLDDLNSPGAAVRLVPLPCRERLR